MTEVVNANPEPVDNLDDLKERFAGFAGTPYQELRMGAEYEEWYVTGEDSPRGIALPDRDTIFAIKEQTEQAMRHRKAEREGKPEEMVGVRPLSKETTSGVLEMSTSAYQLSEIEKIYQDFEDYMATRQNVATEYGVRTSTPAEVPTLTIEEAFEKMLGDKRKEGLLRNFGRLFGEDGLRYAMVTGSVQTSLSYRDPEHMYNILKVANYLSPVLSIIGEETTGFSGNNPQAQHSPPRMKYCHALGVYGSMSQAFLASHDADSYLDGHLNHLANLPLINYFDENGDVYATDPTNMPTWNDLRARGLNTGSNMDFAEGGTYWPDVKLCNIRDHLERPIGKRIEIRMVDRGFWMVALSKMIQEPEGNRQLRDLLADYGFDDRPDQGAGHSLVMAYNAALHRGHKFLDIPYGKAEGNAAPRTMADFAKDLSDVVGKYFAGTQFESRLSGFHHICQTGRTNAKVLQELYPTLEDAKKYLMEAPDEILQNMDLCLDQFREKGVMPKASANRIRTTVANQSVAPEAQAAHSHKLEM